MRVPSSPKLKLTSKELMASSNVEDLRQEHKHPGPMRQAKAMQPRRPQKAARPKPTAKNPR